MVQVRFRVPQRSRRDTLQSLRNGEVWRIKLFMNELGVRGWKAAGKELRDVLFSIKTGSWDHGLNWAGMDFFVLLGSIPRLLFRDSYKIIYLIHNIVSATDTSAVSHTGT